MEKNIVAKTGDFLAKNKTPILYIGGAIFIIAIAIPIVRRINSVVNPKPQPAKQFDFLKDINVDYSKATITNQQAKIMANQLVDAMSVFSGTDKKAIENIFDKIKNKEDMIALYKAFGKRKYSYINSGEASGFLWGIFENAVGYADLDLVGWLSEELDFLDKKLRLLVNEKLKLIGVSI